MKKILVIFGTRPEAIKMAPLIKEFKASSEIDLKVCVTAQHREMLDSVLSFFNIIPEYDLNIFRPNQDLVYITNSVLKGVSDILDDFLPDFVFVHGDTTTTFSAALAACYKKIPIAHVEAGLRTFDLKSPWPEEANRVLTDALSSIYFVPTDSSKNNLLRENKNKKDIYVTGNTVIDALLFAINTIKERPELESSLKEKFSFLNKSKKMILVTAHRRESFGSGFENICNSLLLLSKRDDLQIVFPVHLNPNVQEPVNRILGNAKNISLIEPQDYIPFVYLMDQSYLIITDSGGIQEEAPSLGKPVLVIRDTTERPEAIEAGTVVLAGTQTENIYKTVLSVLDDESVYSKMSKAINPYGDGLASKRILSRILDHDAT